jgi:hypothetical protein
VCRFFPSHTLLCDNSAAHTHLLFSRPDRFINDFFGFDSRWWQQGDHSFPFDEIIVVSGTYISLTRIVVDTGHLFVV